MYCIYDIDKNKYLQFNTLKISTTTSDPNGFYGEIFQTPKKYKNHHETMLSWLILQKWVYMQIRKQTYSYSRGDWRVEGQIRGLI